VEGAGVVIDALHQPAVLYVKNGEEWLPIDPRREFQGRARMFSGNVVQPLHYRVKWKNEWGRRYLLTPTHPLRLEKFEIRLRPPIMWEESRKSRPFLKIKGLAGSVIDVEAQSSQPLAEGRLCSPTAGRKKWRSRRTS